MRRARLFGCRDRRLMLPQTLSADEVKLVGRNDEHLFGARERFLQRRRVVEIGLSDDDSASREFRQSRRVAGRRDDVRGRKLVGLEQMVDHAASERAGCAGDKDGVGHGMVLTLD